MIKTLHFPKEECPLHIKQQVLALMKEEWPQAFVDGDEESLWNETPETNSTSLVLLIDDFVVSHVSVPWKHIKHEGKTYKVFGLSEVMTHSSYRKQGHGVSLVKEATTFIERNHADVGMFTCAPKLVHFYRQSGWVHFDRACLVGGSREVPLRSDSFGLAVMMKFFSKKVQENQRDFEAADVFLELREGKLW
ncbi:MAG: GNAT family N-acetyltransferase [Bacillus sp. (in: firmicutes)]